MPQLLFYLIVVFVFAEFILSRILVYLNSKNRIAPLPDIVKNIYDSEKYGQSQLYDKAKERLSLWTESVSFILILSLLFSHGFAALDAWIRNYTTSPVLMTLAFFGILFFLYDIIHLPFSIYGTFVIEEKFSFNRITPRIFIFDKLKSYLLGIIIGGGLLALVVYLYTIVPDYFWLIAWGVIGLFSLFSLMFYTSLLLPLFNKLTPLENGETRQAIEQYTLSVNFPLKKIYVMDGSKRSSKANAFFSGIGFKKSIVLFDTLIKDFSTDELVAVLAHEVGHYKRKHVQKGFIISFLQMGVLLFIFNWVMKTPALCAALNAPQSFHISLLAFGLLLSPFSTLVSIAGNYLSRKYEFEADAYSVKTFNESSFSAALRKLAKDNLTNLTPHPAYVFVHYSHPPIAQRLQHIS
jgi:STE24 endopeptidase